jgi:arylsulfatase A-like enzyme
VENGRSVNAHWQLRLGRFCGNGLPVWSGAREERLLDLPAASELAFRFVHGARDAAPVRARVRLDGEVVWEHAGPAAEPVAARVALPPGGRSGARLAFEVEGAPGLGAFFTPVVAPAERGRPGARPRGWAAARPDIVGFLADTLRADALDAELAPALARVAEQALRCAHARAPAAWTLPSIGALLTGLAPGQHGATDEDLALPGEHVTLAERLHAAGYRTGAITDGSFFAPIFGLDQGFEWFSERKQPQWDLDATVAEARSFLDADDGRPVFLVVHTYRTHQPYRTGPDEDARAYDELTARVEADVLAALGRLPSHEEGLAALLPHRDALAELYRAGVRDLDRGFGLLADELERRGYFAHGYLLFTSDHGEALGENDDFFHGQHLWETKLRVPLLLRGPELAPRTLAHTATLLDVAPTLAQLARLPLPEDWPGASLVTLTEERPALAFQLSAKKRQMALLDGTRKLITTPDPAALAAGACEEAYELATDPMERANLAARAAWPADLARSHTAHVAELLAARVQPQKAGVSAAVRAELDELGYGGE